MFLVINTKNTFWLNKYVIWRYFTCLCCFQGNHGEDVKELYYYLDCTPTHSYMKALYKYPQREFPYADLEAENKRRGVWEAEYELLDTGECGWV